MGDGELAEGSVWEAAALASHRNVDNLVLLVDVNRLGQSDPTMYGYDIAIYEKRFVAFGWHTVVVEDGNDLRMVDEAFSKGLHVSGKPVAILCKTKKGAGVSFIEDKPGWHGKPLSQDELTKALVELGKVDTKLKGVVEKPESSNYELGIKSKEKETLVSIPDSKFVIQYSVPTATRKAFGNALLRLGADMENMVVLDGDVKNSSYTEFFATKFPMRFVECFIAEQNMMGIATGFAARGYHPVSSSFACFLSRGADQLRMAAFSGVTMLVNGTHAGVSIGQDGPSQMGLEDIALFRAIHGSTVLYPSDAVSTERLVELAMKQKGITYIRTSRPETPILYDEKEPFSVGGSKVHELKGKENLATVVAAGVTLHEAFKAQQLLVKENVYIRVIDCYSIKPIDVEILHKAAKETKAIIVVEDHYPEGGLGEAVKSALSGASKTPVIHLSVTKTPRSGKPAELLAYEAIDADAIMKTVQRL